MVLPELFINRGEPMKKLLTCILGLFLVVNLCCPQLAWADLPVEGVTDPSGSGINIEGSGNCDGIEDDFDRAICQLKETFGGLRGIVYIVAGFTLLAISFAAIYGKISWGWVGMVGLCLFVLSMAEMVVNYVFKDIANEDAQIDDITDMVHEDMDKSLEDSMSELGIEQIQDLNF